MAVPSEQIINLLYNTHHLLEEGDLGELTVAGAMKVALGDRQDARLMSMSHINRVAVMKAWEHLEDALRHLVGSVSLSDWLYAGRTPAEVLELIDYACTGLRPLRYVT